MLSFGPRLIARSSTVSGCDRLTRKLQRTYTVTHVS